MVTLRELTERDLPTVNGWRGDAELVAGLGAPFRYINPETDAEWFAGYLRRRDREVRLSIFVEGFDGPVGLASLVGIDPVHRAAEVHLLVGHRDARGRGVGTAALAALVAHAFRDLNLHRLEARVLEGNARASRLYERAGFRREGVARGAAYKQGAYRDMVIFARLAEDR